MSAKFTSAWLARRHFSRRKLRNSLIIVAVALSVAMVVSSSIASQSISAQVVTSVRSVGGDVDLSIRKVTAEPFNDTIFNSVANNGAITAENGFTAPRYSGKCILSGTYVPLNLASVVGVDPRLEDNFGFSNSSLSALSSGDNVIVTDDAAAALGIKNGYDVRLGIDLPNGTSRYIDLTVASIVHVEGKGYNGALMVNISRVQWLFASPHQITEIVVKLPNAGNTLRVRDALVQSLSGYGGIEVIAPKEALISSQLSLVNAFGLALDAVAGISLMSAVILSANSLLMAANERKKEMGVLRAVGASRGSLFRIFIFEGMIIGVIGGVTGILVGILVSAGMTTVISSFTGYQPSTLIISLQTIVASFAVGVLIATVGSLYPALVASFAPPAKAMRLRARAAHERRSTALLLTLGTAFIASGVFGALTAASWIMEIATVFLIIVGSLLTISALTRQVVRILGIPAKPLLKVSQPVTVRNIARNRRRTSLTIGVVSIGLTFVIFVGGIQGSLTYGLNDFLYRQLGTDIMIRPASSLNITDIAALGSFEGVSQYSFCEFYVTTIGRAASSVIGYNTTAVVGVEPNTFASVSSVDLKPPGPTDLTLVMGKLSADNHSIALSTKLAADLGVSINDNVTILLYKSVFANFTVVALFYGSGLIQYGDLTLDVASLMSYEAMRSQFNLPEAVGPIPNRATSDGLILVKTTQGEKPSAVAERIKTSGKLGPAQGLDILTSESITQAFAIASGEIVLLFQMLLIVSIVIALLGLSTTMFMSIMERRREIGILRAIGMNKSEALRGVLGEALILGLGGLLLGFIDALLLTWIFLTAISTFGFYLPFVFPLQGTIIAISLTLVISLLSGAYPARVTSKLKIVDALRYE
ncbi:MAG: FtsX-like permease family protein [Promethearchaeati archaeon SRVP18_Atabeyarchaeia-1]